MGLKRDLAAIDRALRRCNPNGPAKPSNPYEAHQQARRERLEAAAGRAKHEASGAFQRERGILGVIPLGQPILVGHHSERRHRRDLARAEGLRRRGMEAEERAAELRHRAEAVGTGGISQDDPEATTKLASKADALGARRDAMKAINAAYRRGGWEAVEASGALADMIAEGRTHMRFGPGATVPFPSYALTNIGARIRQAREREVVLSARTEEVEAAVASGGGETQVLAGRGVRIVDDLVANRTRIYFDAKPGADVRDSLKHAGFRWSPSEGAWQRHLSNQARYWAEQVLRRHGYLNDESVA